MLNNLLIWIYKKQKKLRTVSAFILKNNKNEFLIVKKPRKRHSWQFPQGGVEKNETLLEGALREFREECGNLAKYKLISKESIFSYSHLFPKNFNRWDNYKGATVSFFLAQYENGEIILEPKELIDYKWIKKEEFKNYFEKDYLKIIKL